MAKNGQVHEGGKVGRSSATPTTPFSVDFFDLKSLSFKFGNDIIITFEMRKSYFIMIFWKITFRHFAFRCYLFRQSVIRLPEVTFPQKHFEI